MPDYCQIYVIKREKELLFLKYKQIKQKKITTVLQSLIDTKPYTTGYFEPSNTL